MKKSSLILILAAAGIFAGGCTNTARFDYTGTMGTMLRVPANSGKSIAVLPFMDQRGQKYVDPALLAEAEDYPYGDSGSLWFGIIPLMPFGWIGKEEPEKSPEFISLGYFHANPPANLADAAELSLATSGLFSRVARVDTPANADTDYLFRGSFSNLHYSGTMFSYCVTYIGAPVFWILGAPMGYSRNELWVDFALVERESGKTVWTYRFRDKDYIVHWIYARVGKDASLYAELMRRGMNAAIYDLNSKIGNL
jgi:hypothetical protein